MTGSGGIRRGLFCLQVSTGHLRTAGQYVGLPGKIGNADTSLGRKTGAFLFFDRIRHKNGRQNGTVKGQNGEKWYLYRSFLGPFVALDCDMVLIRGQDR